MRSVMTTFVPCAQATLRNAHLGGRRVSRRGEGVSGGCQVMTRRRHHGVVMKNDGSSQDGAKSPPEDGADIEIMRSRLEGLFGVEEVGAGQDSDASFDGTALRNAIFDRWGVQYDIQPQKRSGSVYVQIMWRYFEQQSFYMDEDEFACHCEAVAILLNRWKVVDYFLDYIKNVKKRPVVGLTVNIRIPGLDAAQTSFEV